MSHVCNKSCGKYEWVMSHKMWHATHVIQRGMRHATHSTSTTTLVHWVMSHVWTKSCGKYECVMSRTMWHVTIVTSHVTHTMSHVTHVTSHVIIQRVMTHKMWHVTDMTRSYGVATISRLLEMIGLFCKRALYKRPYSVKETYNYKEPTNRSHPTCIMRRKAHRWYEWVMNESCHTHKHTQVWHDSIWMSRVSLTNVFRCDMTHS